MSDVPPCESLSNSTQLLNNVSWRNDFSIIGEVLDNCRVLSHQIKERSNSLKCDLNVTVKCSCYSCMVLIKCSNGSVHNIIRLCQRIEDLPKGILCSLKWRLQQHCGHLQAWLEYETSYPPVTLMKLRASVLTMY